MGGFQGALDAAKKHAGADTVQVGPGTFTAQNADGIARRDVGAFEFKP